MQRRIVALIRPVKRDFTSTPCINGTSQFRKKIASAVIAGGMVGGLRGEQKDGERDIIITI